MRQFSLGNAWSKGVAFRSRDAVNIAILLIAIGIIAPFVLQYAMVGSAMSTMNPAMMSQSLTGAGAAAFAGTMLLVVLISYLLQFTSYFGSWRLGLSSGETLAGALIYGVICAVVILLIFAAFVVVMALVAQAGTVGPILMLVVGLPLLAIGAALYTVFIAATAVGAFLFLLILLAFGASMGANPLMAMTGGGALGLVIALLVFVLLFWLAARFSCTTCVMADRKSFNLLAGMTESWRLTSANQVRIMAYLALLGIVLCVILIVLGIFGAASMMGSLQAGGVPEMGLGAQIVALIVGIPFAYLLVLVPAGIYRELVEEVPAAEVFA